MLLACFDGGFKLHLKYGARQTLTEPFALIFLRPQLTSVPYRVLFVCMGNICRSPTAHSVLVHHLKSKDWGECVHVDSAGTHNYHPGRAPDARSQKHALKRGYDLSSLRARQIKEKDFDDFQLIVTMDWDNFSLTQAMCPKKHLFKIRRFADFFKTYQEQSVPDPYYGGDQGFERVLDLLEDGTQGLLDHIGPYVIKK